MYIVSRFQKMLTTALAASCLTTATVRAEGAQEFDATHLWIQCLVAKSRTLSVSPDSAPVVAAAVITLCHDLEGPVRAETEQKAEENLVHDGVALDEAEAKRVMRSIGDRGWNAYLTKMTDNVAAVVVQIRAATVPR